MGNRIDPFARHRAPRKVYKVEAVQPADDHNPEATVTMYLRCHDTPDGFHINSLTEKLARQYVLPENRVKYPAEPLETTPGFPAVGDGVVIVTEPLCRSAASLFVMQSTVDDQAQDIPDDQIYSPEALIAMAASMDIAFFTLTAKASAINMGIGDQLGKDGEGEQE